MQFSNARHWKPNAQTYPSFQRLKAFRSINPLLRLMGIIAATALAYSYTIITNNEKDFANIKGLKIINPMKL